MNAIELHGKKHNYKLITKAIRIFEEETGVSPLYLELADLKAAKLKDFILFIRTCAPTITEEELDETEFDELLNAFISMIFRDKKKQEKPLEKVELIPSNGEPITQESLPQNGHPPSPIQTQTSESISTTPMSVAERERQLSVISGAASHGSSQTSERKEVGS